MGDNDVIDTDLWSRFTSLFAGTPESDDATNEIVPNVVEQVVAQTEKLSQSIPVASTTLETVGYSSGIITGPPSTYQSSVQIGVGGQGRQQTPANTQVLGAEGDLIRRLLDEVKEYPTQAVSVPEAATVATNVVIESPDPVALPTPLEGAVANINGEVADDVSASVVLVVSPGATGTGTVVSDYGHVLTNWHVVKDSPTVLVIPKKPSEASPDAEHVLLADVVRLSRFSDLALLKIRNTPEDLLPVAIAPTPRLDRGQTIHTIGHPHGAVWRHTIAKVSRLKSNGTWHSGDNLTHRGSLISAQVAGDHGDSGAPLFNDSLQLVGISAAKGNKPGQLNALSLETILQFLGDAQGTPLLAGD